MKEFCLIIIVIGVVVLSFWAVTRIDAFLSANRKAIQTRKAKGEIDRLIRSEEYDIDEDEEFLNHFHQLEEFDSADNGVIDLRENKQ